MMQLDKDPAMIPGWGADGLQSSETLAKLNPDYRRFQAVKLFLKGMVLLALIGLSVETSMGNFDLLTAAVAAGLGLAILLHSILTSPARIRGVSVVSAALFMVILGLVISVRGNEDLHLLFALIVPPVLFLLLGYRLGSVFVALFFVAPAAVLFREISADGQSPFQDHGFINLILSYTTIACFSFAYEYMRAESYILMQRLAKTDGQTGVLTKAALVQSFNKLKARYNGRVSILVLDVDAQDALRKELGDEDLGDLARSIATALSQLSRRQDKVGRLGTLEFCLILPDSSIEEAEAFGHRLQERMNGQPYPVAGTLQEISISYGVAEAGSDELDFRTLHDMADQQIWVSRAALEAYEPAARV